MAMRKITLFCLVYRILHLLIFAVHAEKSDDSTLQNLIGDTVELRCLLRSDINDLKWEHRPVNNDEYNRITIGSIPVGNYAGRISISSSSHYNLVIKHVLLSDAGTYRCRDNLQKSTDILETELVVLESSPICKSDAISEVVVAENNCGIDPDYLSLTCSVKYSGNVAPELRWKEVAHHTQKRRSHDNTVSNTISIKAHWNRFTYTCQSSAVQWPCYIVIPRPLYVFNTTWNISLHWPQTVTCLANSSQTCQYKWLKEGKEISTTFTLDLTTESPSGEYRCVADCNIRGMSCTMNPLFVKYEFKSKYFASGEIFWSVIYVAIITSITFILMALTKCYGICRKKINTIRISFWTRFSMLIHQRKDKDNLLAECKSDTVTNKFCRKLSVTGLVKGVTVLGNNIYLVKYHDSNIEEYEKKDLQNCKLIPVTDLKEPRDLISCHQNSCLYVSDCGKCVVHKIYFKLTKTEMWHTKSKPEGLSITQDKNVLVVCPKERKIKMFTSEGDIVREIQLPENMIHPHHAIQVDEGNFLVSYGDMNDLDSEEEHCVCMVSSDGQLKGDRYIGEGLSTDPSRKFWPVRITKTSKGMVLVLAYQCKKIVLLDPELKFVDYLIDFNPEEFDDHIPNRMFLDKDNHLYVTENKENGNIWVFQLNE